MNILKTIDIGTIIFALAVRTGVQAEQATVAHAAT
jgi:hypothetical protein